MGSIVKSVGKAIKKVGKGLKKVIKKIGPALLIAAAVYTGVAFYGAGTMAGGMGSLSTANFSEGLARIGQGIGGFASGLFNPSGSATGIGAASPTSQALFSAGTTGGTAGNIGIGTSSTGAFTGSVTSQAAAQTLSKWVTVANTPSSGMTTGDALAYMTKWNMVQGGLEAWAASGRGKEESRQAEINRDHELQLLQMRLEMEATLAREGLEWDKEKMEAMYSYGGPSKKSGATQNKNWLSTHPATMAPAQTRGLLTQGAIPIQQIGEPTFGRQAPKNISYGGASGSPYSRKPQGLIEKGTAGEFNPNSIRRYV
tara:strand:- start:815 stop:1753 length:939 start_codon:yes stop_codon:yes gene_type:complete